MPRAFVIGVGATAFTRHPDRTFRDLTDEALDATLGDAGLAGQTAPVDSVWFGNCGMHVWGQGNIRGQVCLAPRLSDGTLPADVTMLNVEGGCGTGSLALHGAWKDVLSGESELSLAIGVEKTFVAHDPARILELFLHGADQYHDGEWTDSIHRHAEAVGETFTPHPMRIPFVDVHAIQAKRHMARYGTTLEQIAAVSSKNHAHGALNPKAQYRKAMSVEAVLADKPICPPFTRAMCAPISDGAAAVLVCSEAFLAGLDPAVRARAVEIRASVVAGGTQRGFDAPNVLATAAARAWRRSGVTPAQVDVAEVHDSSSFCELQATELLGFCEVGQGGAYAASGATALGGERPVNPSGGLESKGHPLAATGLGMVEELVIQLRGEAGERQVPGTPEVAVAHNAGGMIGVDEAVCAVTVLAR